MLGTGVPFTLRNPAGLWLLGLLAPLIVFYILKQRRERLRVPSVWLWQAARRDLLARRPFRKLTAQVPLILEALAIVLLALAFSEPTRRGGEIPGQHVAIVIDASASMKAVSADGRTRFALAQEAARGALAKLGPGADVMVIQAGREPSIIGPPDRDLRRVGAAVSRARAGDVEGRLGLSIAAAGDQLRQRPGERRIVLISDGALAERELPRSAVPITVLRVGAALDNTAIVRFDVARASDAGSGREQIQAFVMLEHFGRSTREVFVTLSQKDVVTPLASRRLTIGPGERSPALLTFEPAASDAGTGLVVELSPGDALAADDRAYSRVPPSRKLPVVLAPSQASPWISRALLADPDIDLMGTAVSELPTAGVPDDALVVVEGACPPGLPGGDYLILNPPPGPCYLASVGAVVERPSLTSWAELDPRFRFLTLDGIEIVRARRIEGESPKSSLVRTRDATIVADISLPGRTGTLVAFDVGESNWPLKASFVLFVRNVVELSRLHRRAAATGPIRTGEALRARVPEDATSVEIERPNGERETLAARAGSVVVPEIRDAGFYFLSWGGARPGSALVTANLASSAESDLRERPLPPPLAASEPTAAGGLAQAVTGWSWLLAALALLLIGLDVYWITRRPRRGASAPGTGRPPPPPRGSSRQATA